MTEAVRGEGGILRNKDGKRFMWDYLPEDRRGEYAATDEEAATWVTAQSQARVVDARRPPELSTRDNVSRAIYTEVREGRGSPHGGVFLDISYLPPDHVRRKLPSMYDQFKELADVDITAGPMEVGPTTHYVMGGVRVDAETGASTVPGLFAAGEVAGGMHGANRLGGNSLSDLLVFGARTGAGAAAHAASRKDQPYVDPVQVREGLRELAAPLEREGGDDPYALQRDLQDVMDAGVGIYRVEADLQEAISALGRLRGACPASPSPAAGRSTRAGTSSSRSATCWSSPRRSRAAPCSAPRAAARIAASTIRRPTRPAGATATASSGGAPTARWR